MKIETKIDFWKKRLLDLGKRNKLINFPISKFGQRVSRSSIMIETPSADELWDVLSNFDSNISFPVVTKTDKDIDNPKSQIEFKKTEDESPIFPNGYKTNQMPYEACKTFRALMHKSKEFMDNKGLNALYLAFGFLNWKENGLEGQMLRSPILLMPVFISQDNVSAPFVISRLDSEIVSNNTLLHKLKNDFNIEISEYNEDINWKKYLKVINDECSSLGWNIDYECVQLSMISFQKMAMYSDIEQNAELIANHPIVKIINGDTEELDTSNFSDIDKYDHDSIEPKDVSSVVDADSSQQDAILLAKRGVSFVLQGPPGTGKSQTITNIIAELLMQGKSVLFVSEKLAALQVVYNRLSAAGVNDFCLTLHNPNAKRREIMNQLQNSINLASEKVTLNQKAVYQLDQLVAERQKLNRYVKELHTIVPPLNENIYRVNGYISSLETYPDIDYIYKNAVSVSAEELNRLISLLGDYLLIVKKCGYQQYNPWQGSNLNAVTNLFRQKFSSNTSKLSNSVSNGKKIYSILNSLVEESNLSDKICDLHNWQRLFEHSLKSPHISYDITSKDINKVSDLVYSCQDAYQKKKQAYEAQTKAETLISEAEVVIHKIYDCILRNDIDSLKNLIPEYDNIFSKIRTELYPDRFNPLSDNELLYRQSFTSYTELFGNYADLKAQKANIESECAKIEEELSSEKRLLSEIKEKMISEKTIVTNDYNKRILTIDANSLLQEHKRNYGTILRVLKSSYKYDVNRVDFSNENTSISYDQLVELLKNIVTAQQLQSENDDIIKEIKNIQSRKEMLLSEISAITEQEQKLNCELIEIEKEILLRKKLLSEIKDTIFSKQMLVTNEYNDTILLIDAKFLLEKYKNEYHSILRCFNSSYRNDSNYIRSYSKINKKISYNQSLELLNNIINAQKIKLEYGEKEKEFEKTKNSKEKLISDISLITKQKKNYEHDLAKIEELLLSKEQHLSEIKGKLMTLKTGIMNEYNDTVFLIDAKSLLEMHEKYYNSTLSVLTPFKKFFNITLSYTQAIELLNNIISAQRSINEYDNKAESVSIIEEKRSKLLSELSSITTQISNSTVQLQNSKASVIENKRNLCNKLDDMVTNYKNTANDRQLHCDKLYKELSAYVDKTVDDSTNFKALNTDILWLKEFVVICDNFEIGNSYRYQVCEMKYDYNDRLNTAFKQFSEWKKSYKEICDSLFDFFDDDTTKQMANLRMQELLDRITICCNSYSMLEYYVDYKHLISQMESTGLVGYIKKTEEIELSSDNIIPCFKKCFFRSWLDDVIPQFESVATFRSEKQETIISGFKSLDKEQMEIAKAHLKAKLISRLPNLDSFIVGGTEVSILRRELVKQRKLMPLRKLIAVLPTLLPALKPCMMMSPLSVSTYFRNTDYKFDTVIFDEASQVRTEDAICSIFRGNQVIIAGDSKQLPPTDFFSASFADSDEFSEDEEEFDDAGAYESLLDEASSLPTQTLLWHYRSKNEQLIAFSNQKIYNGNLITFPSAVEKEKDTGVEYIYTQNGIYDRGGRNGNRVEAEKVAELVFKHIKNNGSRSLGVIAFNEKQQTIIEDVIIRKRQENPQYEYFFKDSENEAFFIRNLETVQGDERDTIIFSIGFGFDKDGKFLMNFGPLSKSGGERRLNVAITRARYNLKLVGSIMPTDINVDKINSLGPKLLRQYIEYAINGPKTIISEIQVDGTVSFDSPFEESVYMFLVNEGYDVATQVGCSGYRIDIAVRHPDYNGHFAIGIECDGATYHSARTARERDRLRQEILESMGWKIYRIWSTDWIKDPNIERKKLLDAVKKSILNYRKSNNMSIAKLNNDTKEQYLNVSKDMTDQMYLKVKSDYAGMNVRDVPIKDIENTILKVLEIGYGYDMDNLIKSTAKYGYNWQRTGKNIKARFNTAFKRLINKEVVIVENGIVKIKK